uniref:(California timema) hypothetical protein n=1 Tax=Timema californicum TaxID=61474 RepID=A0A7R9J6T7_TIMCA|nr:unnamed protein product [Timema californicum]
MHVHPTEIRTSISPSSAIWLNTTSALADYATGAERSHRWARKLDLKLIWSVFIYNHLKGAILKPRNAVVRGRSHLVILHDHLLTSRDRPFIIGIHQIPDGAPKPRLEDHTWQGQQGQLVVVPRGHPPDVDVRVGVPVVEISPNGEDLSTSTEVIPQPQGSFYQLDLKEIISSTIIRVEQEPFLSMCITEEGSNEKEEEDKTTSAHRWGWLKRPSPGPAARYAVSSTDAKTHTELGVSTLLAQFLSYARLFMTSREQARLRRGIEESKRETWGGEENKQPNCSFEFGEEGRNLAAILWFSGEENKQPSCATEFGEEGRNLAAILWFSGEENKQPSCTTGFGEEGRNLAALCGLVVKRTTQLLIRPSCSSEFGEEGLNLAALLWFSGEENKPAAHPGFVKRGGTWLRFVGICELGREFVDASNSADVVNNRNDSSASDEEWEQMELSEKLITTFTQAMDHID